MIGTVLLLGVVSWGSQSVPEDPPTDPRRVVKILQQEVKQFAKDATPLRATPTIATAFPLDLDDPRVAARLTDIIRRPATTDTAADAYIRWQLTSYDVDLTSLTDSQFEMLRSRLPRIQSNPLGTTATAGWANGLRQQETFAISQQPRILDRFNELKEAAAATMRSNAPALAFRKWLINHFAHDPPRSILLQAERLSTLLARHWPTRREVVAMDRSCDAPDPSAVWSRRQLSSLQKALQSTLGMTSPLLERVWFQESVVYVQWGAAGIQDYDVRRWLKAVSP
jgi:hypothetical protein